MWIASNLTTLKQLSISRQTSNWLNSLEALTQLKSLEYLAIPGDAKECQTLSSMTQLKGIVLLSSLIVPSYGPIASLASQLTVPHVLSPPSAAPLLSSIDFFTTIWNVTKWTNVAMTLAEAYVIDELDLTTYIMSMVHQVVQASDPSLLGSLKSKMQLGGCSLDPNCSLPSGFLVGERIVQQSPFSLAVDLAQSSVALKLIEFGADPIAQGIPYTQEEIMRSELSLDVYAKLDAVCPRLFSLDHDFPGAPATRQNPMNPSNISVGFLTYIVSKYGVPRLVKDLRTTTQAGFLNLLSRCSRASDELTSDWLKSCTAEEFSNSRVKLFPIPANQPLGNNAESKMVRMLRALATHHGESTMGAVLSRNDRTGSNRLGTVWESLMFRICIFLADSYPKTLGRLCNAPSRAVHRTLFFHLLSCSANRKEYFPIENEPSAVPLLPPGVYRDLAMERGYRPIVDAAIATGAIDWPKQIAAGAPSDSPVDLIYLACRVGAVSTLDALLHLATPEDIRV